MCKGTNPTGSTTSTGTSGVPVKSIGVVPTMFLFQPDGENIKYDDFESIRLWVINHIDDFYVNPYGKNTNWIKNGMNFEGCLVKLKKGKPWASLPEINGKKYQVYFTSIPLNPADVDLVCNGLGTHNNDELTASRKDIKRPYPDDPASVSLRQNDIPAKLRNDPKLLAKDHDITYDSSKRLLSSAPTMPEKVKDELIKFPGTNRTFKAAVKALHTGSNLKEFKNIWVIEIPEAKLFRAANIKKLTYWETLMYQENTTPALEKYRKLQRQRLFTEKHYKELRLLLRDIRGNFVFYYNSNLKPSMPHKDGPPKVVYDNRTHSLTGLGWPKEAMEKGPFWICSESEDAREGVDKGEEKVEEEDTGGTKVLLHKLDTKFTPLPKPIPLLPSVDHKVINLIKTETKNLVKNLNILI